MNLSDEFLQKSDFFNYLFLLPLKTLLILFSFVLVITPNLSIYLLFPISLITLSLFLITMTSSQKRRRFSLWVGGDLLIVLFVITTLIQTNEPLQSHPALWVFSLYLLTYSFTFVKGVNSRTLTLIIGAFTLACYALFSAFTGFTPELYGFITTLAPSPFPELLPSLPQGLTVASNTLALQLSLLIPYPLSLIISHPYISSLSKAFCAITATLIALVIGLTFSKTSYLVFLAALFFTLFLNKKKKQYLLLITISILSYIFIPQLAENTPLKNLKPIEFEQSRKKLQAELKVFQSSPWIGVGFSTSFEKRNDIIGSNDLSPTPNTYFKLLSGTGLLGFAFYMLFFIFFILKNMRLLQEIPKSHFWHRTFSASSLAGQLSFHTAGLFTWTLGQSALIIPTLFSIATVAYLSNQYLKRIVPDDYCL